LRPTAQINQEELGETVQAIIKGTIELDTNLTSIDVEQQVSAIQQQIEQQIKMQLQKEDSLA
jgi:hypothetical protein